MKHFYLLGICLLWSFVLPAQNPTISGYIYDSESNEQLIGANVYDLISQKGSISNSYGYYSLSPPSDQVDLEFSYIGYSSKSITIDLKQDTIIDIYL